MVEEKEKQKCGTLKNIFGGKLSITLVVFGIGLIIAVSYIFISNHFQKRLPKNNIEILEYLKKTHETNVSIMELSGTNKLDLRSLKNINNSEIKALEKLSGVESLNLSGCNITDVDIRSVAKISTLKNLYIKNCHGITDTSLKHISNLDNLKTLDLSWCTNITDVGLNYLNNLSSLERLFLSCLNLSDHGMQSIGKLIGLKKLEVVS